MSTQTPKQHRISRGAISDSPRAKVSVAIEILLVIGPAFSNFINASSGSLASFSAKGTQTITYPPPTFKSSVRYSIIPFCHDHSHRCQRIVFIAHILRCRLSCKQFDVREMNFGRRSMTPSAISVGFATIPYCIRSNLAIFSHSLSGNTLVKINYVRHSVAHRTSERSGLKWEGDGVTRSWQQQM